MKKCLFGFILIASVACAGVFPAHSGEFATEKTINMLKKDLLKGKIQVGKTRLRDVILRYGEAESVTETDRKITYNYGDLNIQFDKKKYWRGWEIDSFKKNVYTDSVDDLRFDLDSQSIVGDNITYSKIRQKYDDPTESMEKSKDGETSIYYYGNIKMIFENVFTVRTFRGQNLTSDVSSGILQSGKKNKKKKDDKKNK